jgi:hypothetical protein
MSRTRRGDGRGSCRRARSRRSRNRAASPRCGAVAIDRSMPACWRRSSRDVALGIGGHRPILGHHRGQALSQATRFARCSAAIALTACPRSLTPRPARRLDDAGSLRSRSAGTSCGTSVSLGAALATAPTRSSRRTALVESLPADGRGRRGEGRSRGASPTRPPDVHRAGRACGRSGPRSTSSPPRTGQNGDETTRVVAG